MSGAFEGLPADDRAYVLGGQNVQQEMEIARLRVDLNDLRKKLAKERKKSANLRRAMREFWD